MEMASKAGLGTKSIIILGASAVDRSDPSKEVRNSFCNWRKKFSSTSIQGAFMLPDCPSHAARCGDRPNLCKEEEKDHWKCKCTLGYEGDLKIPGLQETPSRGPFNYEGECKPISGYCPVNGKYPLKQLNGANAVGFLGETVTPQCPTGFEATGSSECAESQSHEGKWSPEPRCDFLPSTMPQKPFCLAPEHKGSLHLTKCNMCSAVEPGKKGPSCDCEVQCATDYEVLGEKKGGKKACIAKEFPCPPATLKDSQCVNSDTNEPTQPFCCDEAWGPNIPPPSLTARTCSEIKEDKECLTSQQSASGADAEKAGEPCCWSRSSSTCTVKSEESQSPCAVAKRVMVAEWQDLPTCVPPCEDNFDTGFLETQDCEKCYPSGTTAQPCGCQVKCHGDSVRIGGGLEGNRTCEAKPEVGGFQFDGSSPACWSRPPPLLCPSVEGTGREVEGCDCEVGDEKCECKISCQYGFTQTSPKTGPPKCHEKPLESEVKDCMTMTDANECLKSHAKSEGAAPVPCCHRKEPCPRTGSEKSRVPRVPLPIYIHFVSSATAGQQDGFGTDLFCLPSGDPRISPEPQSVAAADARVGRSKSSTQLFYYI
ncbi:unnamed protein product [Durusdinium trenchii]|uniref:Uncharacterized protein n=1 Tax=Durusdinium trenchii TaxID=1381693 RepID=A0ABP0PDN4_9DINO